MAFVGVPCYQLICPVISACLFSGNLHRKGALRAGIFSAVAAAVLLFAKCAETTSLVDCKVVNPLRLVNGSYSTSL